MSQNSGVIVMSEVPALNDLLGILYGTDRSEPIVDSVKLRTLRNLVLALGRRRRPTERYYVVKFSSWNVKFAESIQSVFPGVPCLFVYRDPAEVMVSLVAGPSGYVTQQGCKVSQLLTGLEQRELSAMGQIEYIARCLLGIMTAGLSMPQMRYWNYSYIRKQSLHGLLRHLNLDCSVAEVAEMAAQFDFDAKSLSPDVPFVDDTAVKRRAITQEIRESVSLLLAAPFEALEVSERNLQAHLGERENYSSPGQN